MNPSDEHADSVFYGIAAKEIHAGNVDVGLMAKAVAKARGNKKEAEVLYLEWRVDLLKEAALNKFTEQETIKEENRKVSERIKKQSQQKIWIAEWINDIKSLIIFIIIVALMYYFIFEFK